MNDFGLIWPGKENALQALNNLPQMKLIWDGGESIYRCIYDDNLRAMQAMASQGIKVNVIYIDPPYNTGNRFVYSDQFKTKGPLNSTNKHGDWLNMMYPRLTVAKRLLLPSGVIFVSIDHHEQAHLQLIMDEIFGEHNRCGTIIWERKKKPSYLKKQMVNRAEYILAYAKDIKNCPVFSFEQTKLTKRRPFNNISNKYSTLNFPPHSIRFSLSDQTIESQDMSTPNVPCVLHDAVIIQNGRNLNSFRISGQWRYSQSTVDKMIRNKQNISISKVPFRLNVTPEKSTPKPTGNLFTVKGEGIDTYEDAAKEIIDIFGYKAFDYPKPVGLIKRLLKLVMSNGDTALDFFAGTGTLGQAVIELNAEDNGQRKFICIQDDVAPADDSLAHQHGVKSIADLCNQRIVWSLAKHSTVKKHHQIGKIVSSSPF